MVIADTAWGGLVSGLSAAGAVWIAG
jgi:hypothetical protein